MPLVAPPDQGGFASSPLAAVASAPRSMGRGGRGLLFGHELAFWI